MRVAEIPVTVAVDQQYERLVRGGGKLEVGLVKTQRQVLVGIPDHSVHVFRDLIDPAAPVIEVRVAPGSGEARALPVVAHEEVALVRGGSVGVRAVVRGNLPHPDGQCRILESGSTLALLEIGTVIPADTDDGEGESRPVSVEIVHYVAHRVPVVVGQRDAVLNGEVGIDPLPLGVRQHVIEDQDFADADGGHAVTGGAVDGCLAQGIGLGSGDEGVLVGVDLVDQRRGTVAVGGEVRRATGRRVRKPEQGIVPVLGVVEAELPPVKYAVGEVIDEDLTAVPGDEILDLQQVFVVKEIENVIATVSAGGVRDAGNDKEGGFLKRVTAGQAEVRSAEASVGVYRRVEDDAGVKVHQVSGGVVTNRRAVAVGVVSGPGLVGPGTDLATEGGHAPVRPQPEDRAVADGDDGRAGGLQEVRYAVAVRVGADVDRGGDRGGGTLPGPPEVVLLEGEVDTGGAVGGQQGSGITDEGVVAGTAGGHVVQRIFPSAVTRIYLEGDVTVLVDFQHRVPLVGPRRPAPARSVAVELSVILKSGLVAVVHEVELQDHHAIDR